MRRLGHFEEALTLTDEHAPLNAVAVVRLADGPAPEVLRAALAELRRRHPLLRARLVRSVRGHAFVEGAPEIPLAEAERASEESWQALAENELSTAVDTATGPLMRATYLTSPESERAELVLTFHHAAMDATSATAFLGELLERCDAIRRGEPRSAPQELAPLPPVEARFPGTFQGTGRAGRTAFFLAREIAGEIAYRVRTRHLRRPPIHREGAANRILCLELDPEATRRLVAAVRRERLSLMCTISAAALLAVARHLYGGEERPLRSLLFTDLRPYVRPRPRPEDLGAYFAMMRLAVRLGPRQGFWHLARKLNEKSYAALKRGDRYAAGLLAPTLMRTLLRSGRERMAATGISYTGPLRLASAYGATRLVALHAFVSNIDLGPELTAQVRLHDSRLQWDFVYLASDFDPEGASRLAEAVLLLLRDAAGAVDKEKTR